MPATGGTDDSGKVVVDIPGVQRAAARLADAAQAYDQLAARIRNRPLPEMPPGLAAYVTAELADFARLLGAQTEPLVATAKELRVRAFWAEIADKLEGGYDLQGAQLTEFKAAYASGLLTQYAEPGLAELADAYAQKVHDREHEAGWRGVWDRSVAEFATGTWAVISGAPEAMYGLVMYGPDAQKHEDELARAVAAVVSDPAAFAKAFVNVDALHQHGVVYWLGTVVPSMAMTVETDGAGALLRGGEGMTSLERAAATTETAAQQAERDAASGAAAVAAGRLTPGQTAAQEEAALARGAPRPFGSGRGPHTAQVTVTRNGEAVAEETLTSGGMTSEEAGLGFPRSTLATHTEARAVTQYPLKPGDVMTIRGKYPPCPSCKGAMNRAARSQGATIHYEWPGGTWTAGGQP